MNYKEGIIWAAGLFDGEGCIAINKAGKRFTLGCQLEMTHEETVKRYAYIVGVGFVSKKNNKNIWFHGSSGKDAIAVVKQIFPWLITKRLQAELALEYGEKCLLREGKEKYGVTNPIPDEVRSLREIIYEELCKLNK